MGLRSIVAVCQHRIRAVYAQACSGRSGFSRPYAVGPRPPTVISFHLKFLRRCRRASERVFGGKSHAFAGHAQTTTVPVPPVLVEVIGWEG